jgi:hypothetical protein
VKSTIEQTRLSLAADAGERAELKLSFAEQRLNEIQVLISEGRYGEVAPAVLEFEADLNSAILELETIARLDPARGSRIALEITSALSRFAQSLTTMTASAPESVQSEVARALDTTGIAGSLDLPSIGSLSDDHGADESTLQEDGECIPNVDGSADSGGDDSCTVDEDHDSNSSDDNSKTDDAGDDSSDHDTSGGKDDDSSHDEDGTHGDDRGGDSGGGGGGGDD